jgi:hypothetical protein
VKFTAIILAVAAFFVFVTISAMANTKAPEKTYQGKTVVWWAKHAVKARKDANTRAVTIRRLKATMAHDPTLEECVKLATIAYPAFSEARAWQIIYHESWTSGKQFAKNRSSTASGLYQFLTSTFASTPYGKAGMSIWSPCASSLAAGWMHENGRGGEWAIG